MSKERLKGDYLQGAGKGNPQAVLKDLGRAQWELLAPSIQRGEGREMLPKPLEPQFWGPPSPAAMVKACLDGVGEPRESVPSPLSLPHPNGCPQPQHSTEESKGKEAARGDSLPGLGRGWTRAGAVARGENQE